MYIVINVLIEKKILVNISEYRFVLLILVHIGQYCYVSLKGRQQSKSYWTQHFSILSGSRMCYQKSYNNNLQSIDDWQLLLNHNKQWTRMISTVKDNWTQQLRQSPNRNNAINIMQHAFPFLFFFFSMSHITNIKVIYILMEF